MRKRTLFSILFAALTTVVARADEGMYMLTDLKAQNAAAMQDLGLQIPIEQVYADNQISLKDAVVHFGGGCTAEVISSEGLLLTNHHCGYGAIQSYSSVAHDYLTDGFWAMNRQEELPCKDLTITFIDRILDVTGYVNEQLKKDEDPEGTNYLSPTYLSKVAKRFAEEQKIEQSKFKVLELKPFYGSNRYYLFVKTVYRDIRMVGAPPSSIGKFGADTDNWMWPRHTGDFSLFRIYADKDGNPTDYAADNVPLKVKKHLKINLGGVEQGDFAMVMGFPGRNWRYMISDEVEERMQTTNFMRHHVRDARQQILMEEMLKDPAVRIYYASKYASSANYWKNAIGMNEGLVRLKVLDTKRAQQEQLLARGKVKGDNSYQQAFDQIRAIVAERRSALYHQQALQETLITGLDFMKQDTIAYPEVEKRVAKRMLEVYCEYIPKEQRISIFAHIQKKYKGSIDRFVEACFRKPQVKELLKQSITEGVKQTVAQMKEVNKNYDAAHKVWVRGMMELRQEAKLPIYPDANSTLRLTYGKVKNYEPADGVIYDYYTTMKGIMEKEDSTNFEFVVPIKLKQLYQQKDFGRYAMKNGEMPVGFIVDTDNTGGNSGSPVLNGKGELIGTGFDRNYEGLTGDIAFRPSSQRAVCVDIRYTLFIIEKYAGAKHLIEELDLVK